LRHRVEHAAIVPPWLLPMLREAGLIVVTHPGWIYWNGDRYRAEVPAHQQPWLYRLGSLRRSGIGVASASDSPVSPWDPMASLYGAVTRRTASGAVINVKQGLSVDKLWQPPRDRPLTCRRGGSPGRIAARALADLVVLDRDPTRLSSPDELLEVKVAATIAGGRLVWERPQAEARDVRGRAG
jgi:predicted amidohydrolase YtcJ